MDKKGIIIDSYTQFYFQRAMLNEFEKRVKRFEINEDKNIIKKYIKDNDIKYMIVGYSYDYITNPLSGIDIPIIVGAGDAPRRLAYPGFKEMYRKNNACGIITQDHCTIDLFKEYLSPLDSDIFMYHWGVDLNIIKDYNYEKEIDVSNTGKFSDYQYRTEIHELFSNIKEFNYKRNRNIPLDSSSKWFIKYAKELNKCWMSIGGCTQRKDISHYNGRLISDTFPKNIEIPGCKCCLLTSDWGDREYLGFKDGENCIIFKNARDARRKVSYYLNDKELLMKMINSGYDLIQKNHNVVHTISDLLDRIEYKYAR